MTVNTLRQFKRPEQFDPSRDRITLTEVRRRILGQTSLFRPEDIIPVPCHPDSLAMAYALKSDSGLMPLMRPRMFGGYEADWMTQIDCVSEVARFCGSTGWCKASLRSWCAM